MKINKDGLVEFILENDAFETKKQAKEFLEDFVGFVADSVAQGTEVSIAGFGKFEKYERQNGAFKPKFTAFTAFKDKVTA